MQLWMDPRTIERVCRCLRFWMDRKGLDLGSWHKQEGLGSSWTRLFCTSGELRCLEIAEEFLHRFGILWLPFSEF